MSKQLRDSTKLVLNNAIEQIQKQLDYCYETFVQEMNTRNFHKSKLQIEVEYNRNFEELTADIKELKDLLNGVL